MTEANLMTVAETAALSRLKESTIRKWILKRKITHVKLGRRVLVRRQDIESLIAESVVPARKGLTPLAAKKGAAKQVAETMSELRAHSS